MKKLLGFGYATLSYILFLGAFVYLIGFVGDILVPTSIDGPSSTPLAGALLLDIGLLALFAVQHSVMARSGFKRWWTRIVPKHLERATYVLAASLTLGLLMWAWQPMPRTVWSIESSPWVTVLDTLFWIGWGVVLLATFLIDHFRLFGLKQAWCHLRGRDMNVPEFQTPGLYRFVRHPLYLGFLLAFWSTPYMTVGRLLLSGVWTGWILLAIQLEERELIRFHGTAYERYRERVRMLVPIPRASGRVGSPGTERPSQTT